MRWFRANVRLGIVCAYFALAVQLVLSFGHLHIGAYAGFPYSTLFLAQSTDEAPDFGTRPKPQPVRPGDDFCPFCILIHLAGSMMAAAAPSPSPPMVVTVMPPAIEAGHAPALSLLLSFQARAPPLA
jgi:hypothetical protein